MAKQIVIGSFRDELDAHMACAYLEREGIESFIRDEHYIGIEPLHWIAMGGVKVTVDMDDETEARVLIARYEAEQFQGYESQTHTCPSCGSINVKQPGYWRVPLVFLAVLTLGLFAWLVRDRRNCVDCGHQW